jgi:hypothetical protein
MLAEENAGADWRGDKDDLCTGYGLPLLVFYGDADISSEPALDVVERTFAFLNGDVQLGRYGCRLRLEQKACQQNCHALLECEHFGSCFSEE